MKASGTGDPGRVDYWAVIRKYVGQMRDICNLKRTGKKKAILERLLRSLQVHEGHPRSGSTGGDAWTR